MGFRGLYFIFVILFVYLLKHANSFPRDSSVAKTETISESNGISPSTVKASPVEVVTQSVTQKIPGRVYCQYEDATEDAVCQEHCLPKGYWYGICVSGTCSCI